MKFIGRYSSIGRVRISLEYLTDFQVFVLDGRRGWEGKESDSGSRLSNEIRIETLANFWSGYGDGNTLHDPITPPLPLLYFVFK